MNHDRRLLRERREPLEFLDTQSAKLDAQIQEQVRAYAEAIALWTAIPGIEPDCDFPRA